ncbi:Haloacid dehalogenase type II [Penicillium brevicompactum]|uniref:Haloacid dehalogenase type II n=1 Tax=Penicillium brevicompactum TaxID=5074 RepID=A0A9W9UCZ3_PENBR|nr:Haloacid dehalogenase type II [Penicillium brevicompactum]
MAKPTIKAVFFDFMGTCLDWHSSVVQALPSAIPPPEASKLALEWRRQYFIENSNRVSQRLNVEDIDITLARSLDLVLARLPDVSPHFDDRTKLQAIQAWHKQRAWPEVSKAIQSLQENLGLEVFVHANGTTRLQLDLTRSSGLKFNMMFSSQLLGAYKPNREAYEKGLELVKLRPEEVVLVAAHAYDLRGARDCGLRTVYVHRWTDDVDENMEQVRSEFDAFLEDMRDLAAVIRAL